MHVGLLYFFLHLWKHRPPFTSYKVLWFSCFSSEWELLLSFTPSVQYYVVSSITSQVLSSRSSMPSQTSRKFCYVSYLNMKFWKKKKSKTKQMEQTRTKIPVIRKPPPKIHSDMWINKTLFDKNSLCSKYIHCACVLETGALRIPVLLLSLCFLWLFRIPLF